jgi:TfoX/Sxy family transcriptional regulator of competence genes
MASDQNFVDYICEQADLPGDLTSKKMFGEYALYLNGKVIALICDNQLFVKPTSEGKALLGAPMENPPYPGAKLYFQIAHEMDDRDLIKRLFLVTAQSLPLPKPKAPKLKPSPQPIKKKT